MDEIQSSKLNKLRNSSQKEAEDRVFQNFKVDKFGCDYLNFKKKPRFPEVIFLRGPITKSWVLFIFNSF